MRDILKQFPSPISFSLPQLSPSCIGLFRLVIQNGIPLWGSQGGGLKGLPLQIAGSFEKDHTKSTSRDSRLPYFWRWSWNAKITKNPLPQLLLPPNDQNPPLLQKPPPLSPNPPRSSLKPKTRALDSSMEVTSQPICLQILSLPSSTTAIVTINNKDFKKQKHPDFSDDFSDCFWSFSYDPPEDHA